MKQTNYLLSRKSFQQLLLSSAMALLSLPAGAQCPDNNHPHMVDLGLPSSTKWACCNVGADKPEAHGGYYAWGETEVKASYDYDTYLYFTSWNDWPPYQNIGRDICRTDYDVAYKKWGDSWQMPRKEQIQELIDHCTAVWSSQNGVQGMTFTGTNGKSIFLPASGPRWSNNAAETGTTGCFWSSELRNTGSSTPYTLDISATGATVSESRERCSGIVVRPVTPKTHSGYVDENGGWVERVTNGSFDGDDLYSFWYNYNYQSPQADQIVADPADATNRCIKLAKVNQYGQPDFYVNIHRNLPTLLPGQNYKLSMRIKASQPTQFQLWWLSAYGAPLDNVEKATYSVTTEWTTTISLSGTISDLQAGAGVVGFLFSDSSVDYYLDDISFQAETGGTFTSTTVEGSELIFTVVSEDEATCAVGNLLRTDGLHEAYTDILTAGTLTLPSTVEHQGKTYAVKFVGDGAFAGNTVFTDIIIPEGVTYLASSAFWFNCLQRVSIPSTIRGFGHQVFSGNSLGNSLLESVYCHIQEPFPIEETLFSTNAGSFTTATLYVPVGTKSAYEATAGWNLFTKIVEMTPYDVLDDNTVAAHFLEPDDQGKIVIPEKVTLDGKTYTVTAIAANAFKNNTRLTELTIPATVTTIGLGAFAGCTNLQAIYVLAPQPISLETPVTRSPQKRADGELVPSQFEGIDFDACTLYVPNGSEQLYREAEGWRLFTHIVGMEAPSGIATVSATRRADEAVYNLNGQRVATPAKGLYIIGNRKVMVK